MRLGILSDTHGDPDATRRAARVLEQRGVDTVFHCGDIGSASVLDELTAIFGAHACPVYAVLGNCDYVVEGHAAWGDAGVRIFPGPHAAIACMDFHVALAHGTQPTDIPELLRAGRYRYIFTGHTHRPADVRIHGTRVINPGAVSRPRAPWATVAWVDARTDELVHINIHNGQNTDLGSG